MNSMINQSKALTTEDPNSEMRQELSKNIVTDHTTKMRNSMFVKVTMDGIPIGRKIDLNAHKCYESLSNTLEEMFLKPKTGAFYRFSWPFFLEFSWSEIKMMNLFFAIRFRDTRNRWSCGNTAKDTTRWVFWIGFNVRRQGRGLDACWRCSVGVCMFLCFQC